MPSSKGMGTAKVQQTLLSQSNDAKPKANRGFWGRLPRVRGLQVKLIAPYLILTMAIAFIGVFISTVLVVESDRERFFNSLIDASRVANDAIVQQERSQLERLRFLVFADGMAQAMYDKDSQQINNLMRPIIANENIDVVAAIDMTGTDIVTFGKDPQTDNFFIQQGVVFSGLSSIGKVLDSVADNQGDKYVELVRLEQGPVLFTSAPVRDSQNNLAGAMLVGSYLDDVLLQIKEKSLADVVVLDQQGNPIATTLIGTEEGYPELIAASKTLNGSGETQTIDITLNQRPYQVAYSPLLIRGQQAGWLGMVKSSEYLTSPAVQSRQLLTGLFLVGTFAVILIGWLLAQNIARPVLRLRSLSQAVAAGDLDQSFGLHRNDEIGELGEAFDTMTLHLRERTEEAQRLYSESLQRNRELAVINSRLEAAQLQLIQSEKLASIGHLTAGIVHDVKNPFAVIMGMAEVLGEEENLDEATRHGLKVIRESAIKGNNIVSDLLKFARQTKPEMRTADLRETVQSAMRLTAYLTRRFTTEIDLPEQPLMVTYDAQQIEQVLINMIHNAVQAMPDGGRLCLSLKNTEDTAFLSVQDTGVGISPEQLKRIFDPFYTTKSEGEGTGLGLSVSYGMIANHHGRIDVVSEIGKGSTFTIVLPIHQSA